MNITTIIDIAGIWENALDYIQRIKDIIVEFKDIVLVIFDFFPSPFKQILIAFLIIFIAIIIYKTLRG